MRTHDDFGRLWGFEREPSSADERSQAIGEVIAAVDGLIADERGSLARAAATYLVGRMDAAVLADAVRRLVGAGVAAVIDAGWTPTDLVEIVRRRGSVQQLATLSAFLADEADRQPSDRFTARWHAELARLPRPEPPDLYTVAGLERVLGLAAVLALLPPILAISEEVVQGGPEPKHLRRVRALLAKAESTDSPEEAEAFSAKAQELISRYALDRLVRVPDDPDAALVGARRIWIDAPYVLAKATLIGQVAEANRCRTVVSKSLGFCTVVGERGDLDAVEMLATSLLVQAQTAVLRHGRDTDGRGTSRTRSFRRSFLIAYAARVGERLRATSQEATAATSHSAALVPVLKRRAERVDAARDEMFPTLGRSRSTTISNGLGWAAGVAAADLARLDGRARVSAGGGRGE